MGQATSTNFLTTAASRVRSAVEDFGYVGALLIESVYWMVRGRSQKQPVKFSAIFHQMMQIGVEAIPIVATLAFTVGIMLAIQLIYVMKEFGAESQVVLAIAVAVTREFAPLITGILVAGRSGSSLAARIGSMTVSQEIDALRVIGVNPVRYLAAPALLALLIMMPTLTIIADFAGILGGALYSVPQLDTTMSAYLSASVEALEVGDVMQGLAKAAIFGVIIALVGVSSGFKVEGGAEGVGRTTTRSVVLSISFLVIADMIFTFFLNR